MITIKLSRAYCEEDMKDCVFSFNENTGITTHCKDMGTEMQSLEAQGYRYQGHKNGVYTYCLYKAAPLTADEAAYQMALNLDAAFEAKLQNQDW